MTEEEEVSNQTLAISQYNSSFGDISSLEALVNDADEKLKEKGFNVEHFSEMRKIVKRIKSQKQT